MRTLLYLAFAGCIGALEVLSAAPSIASQGVKNSASYANPGFPNGSIAQGSLFVVFGTGLGPAQIQYASSFPLPTTLSGTSVSVTVNGSTVQCPVIYTLDGQIAAILPSTTTAGTGTIVVSYNGVASASAPIKVVPSSPGIFTVNQQGSGPGVIQDANGKPNALNFAFNPGQQVVIWGTGLGPISGSDANVPPSGNLPGVKVTANIGGKDAAVAYSGRSANAGVDQINVILPAGVTGCYVPVYLTATGASGAVSSNFVTIAIAASGNNCVDPNFPAGVSGNGYKSGNINVTRSATMISAGGQSISTNADSGGASFLQFDPAYLAGASGSAFSDITIGSCIVIQGNGGTANGVLPKNLDAGPAINVTGPNGTKTMPRSNGGYGATFSNTTSIPGFPGLPGSGTPFLEPGNYTLDNGGGGADVGPFKLNLTVPPTLVWNEQTTLTSVDRTQPLRVTWKGGDPNAQVQVFGTSFADQNAFAAFVCYAKDSDGGLTVPAAILSLLPPSANLGQGGSGGMLSVTSQNSVNGTAPGLDILTASALFALPNVGVTYK